MTSSPKLSQLAILNGQNGENPFDVAAWEAGRPYFDTEAYPRRRNEVSGQMAEANARTAAVLQDLARLGDLTKLSHEQILDAYRRLEHAMNYGDISRRAIRNMSVILAWPHEKEKVTDKNMALEEAEREHEQLLETDPEFLLEVFALQLGLAMKIIDPKPPVEITDTGVAGRELYAGFLALEDKLPIDGTSIVRFAIPGMAFPDARATIRSTSLFGMHKDLRNFDSESGRSRGVIWVSASLEKGTNLDVNIEMDHMDKTAVLGFDREKDMADGRWQWRYNDQGRPEKTPSNEEEAIAAAKRRRMVLDFLRDAVTIESLNAAVQDACGEQKYATFEKH